MNHAVPEPWATALVRAGLTDPRYTDPRPSLGRLAQAVGVHTSTVSAMVHGRKATAPDTVAAAAQALRLDVTEVSRWVNRARSVAEPYQVPAEANLLSRRQQDALTELIRAMADRGEVVGNAEHPAPMNATGEQPDTTTPAPAAPGGGGTATPGVGPGGGSGGAAGPSSHVGGSRHTGSTRGTGRRTRRPRRTTDDG